MARLATRSLALGYLAVVLAGPVSLVFYRTFRHGLEPVWQALAAGPALHAFGLTLLIAAIAVPANTIFGVACAHAIVRGRIRGGGLLNALVDLPLALSPVVVGLALFVLYGRTGRLGPWLAAHGIQVLFALPSMVIATIFVSLPFVVREVVPVLRELGTDQEQAAATLGASRVQTFWRVTLPSIRWAVTYGVVLTTARSLGEYGAVAVVSGRIAGKTETATLLVEDRYQSFDLVGAYSASVLLALIAVCVLVALKLAEPAQGAR